MTPKVFLSHASEDKERFVLAFATRLRQNGIDVWLDKWEMLPGASFHRIVAAILGHTDKPSLGSPPAYNQTAINDIGGLTKMDNLVLKLSCEHAIENNERFVNPGLLFLKDGQTFIPESELSDALDMLDRNGYVKLSKTIVAGLSHYQITTYGLDSYARAYLPHYAN